MPTNLYKKTAYTINSSYAIGSIFEYDISKANISILRQMNLITEDQYKRYYVMDKREREINIGLLQKNDPKYKEALEEGFMESRRFLLHENNVEDNEIISIKKDAIFVTRPMRITKLGYIEFTLRNVYQMMVKTNNPKLEFYFALLEGDNCNIDVKGVKDSSLPFHTLLLSKICSLFSHIINGDIEEAVSELSELLREYSNRSLPLEYYREFNSLSHYRIVPGFYSEFTIDRTDESARPYLNIDYNLNLLTDLYKIISDMYVNRKVN